MSYILEALRKVEQQQEHQPALGLSSRLRFHTVTFTAAPRPRRLIIALITVGAFLSGVLSVYLTVDKKAENPGLHSLVMSIPEKSGWEQASRTAYTHDNEQMDTSSNEDKHTPLQPVSVLPLQRPEPQYQTPGRGMVAHKEQAENAKALQSSRSKPPQAGKPKPQQPASLPQRIHSVVHSPERIASNNQDISESQAEKSQLPSVKNLSSGQDDASRPIATTQSDTPSEPALLTTLSPQFQDMMPKISIDGIIYSSEPRQSVVVINMKLYNEGQITPEGITVEAIHQEDVICSYRGRRFRLSR